MVAFAARIPSVLADAGDDFSNNLLSDLAPILALFGENVANQYMSHSTSWIEDLIFAIGPLGIITATSGAIRVGSPSYLQAIIGRAREGNGIVELEFMSSTSTDVCELWNGKGISRVQGSAQPAPIIELYHLKYDESSNSIPEEDQSDDEGRGLLESWTSHISGKLPRFRPGRNHHRESYDDIRDEVQSLSGDWDSDPSMIYDFKSGREAEILTQINQNSTDPTNTDSSAPAPPNLGFNISYQRVSVLELRILAAIGILLQTAVLVFAGMTISPGWRENFKKNNVTVANYAFHSVAAGTVAWVLGMFFCARIIERSTNESRWAVKESRQYKMRPRVSWIQRGAMVSDQQFDSYVIHRVNRKPRAGKLWKTLQTHLLANRCFQDYPLQIIRSQKSKVINQGTLTVLATCISVCGFVIQL